MTLSTILRIGQNPVPLVVPDKILRNSHRRIGTSIIDEDDFIVCTLWAQKILDRPNAFSHSILLIEKWNDN
jgi:hypothetical protein